MPKLLSGHALAWLIGNGSGPRPFKVRQQRQGAFGPAPVRGGSIPVERCLPLVAEQVADPAAAALWWTLATRSCASAALPNAAALAASTCTAAACAFAA